MLRSRTFAVVGILLSCWPYRLAGQKTPTDLIIAGKSSTSSASLGTPQSPAVRFKQAVNYASIGPYTDSVAIGDLNGDGRPDLVTTGYLASGSVMLGNGDGTFQPALGFNLNSNGSLVSMVTIADVNGDGKPDLVVANRCTDNSCYPDGSVSILLGNGDGTFEPLVNYDSGGYIASSVAVGDVNGDGHPDLVVSDWCQTYDCPSGHAGGIGVLLGNGDGTFQPVVFYSAGYRAAWAAVADLNHDGRLDVAVADVCQDNSCASGHGAVNVLLGIGDGTFQPAVPYDSGGFNASSVTIGDLNSDGYPDLVVTDHCQDSGCTSGNGAVAALLGNGDGTFREPVTYTTAGYDAVSVAIADVNGGPVDLVVANHCKVFTKYCSQGGAGSGGISVLVGNGDGTFQTPIAFYTGTYGASQVLVADVNGDRRPDLLVANECSIAKGNSCTTNGTVGVLLNSLFDPAPTTVTSSVNPSIVNQAVTFTATVTSSPSIPDGEIITFYDGTTSIGTAPTKAATAILTVSFSKTGTHNVKAAYPGDLYHKAAAGSIKQIVN